MGNGEIRVLLVDDNRGDAEYITELLSESKSLRFRTLVADRLSAGIDYLNREPFDVILMDLTLPDSRGVQSFEKIYDVAQNIPIIIITGVDNESVAAKTLQEGLQDYILKSNLSADLLSRSIRYAIDRKHAETQIRENAARSRVLSEVSRDIANARLDPNLLLQTISASIATWIGDACVIRVLSEDGQYLRKAGVFHRNPGISEDMGKIAEIKGHLSHEGLNGDVMRRGNAVIIPRLTGEQLSTDIRKECLRYYEKAGLASLIMVPLIVEGRVIGTICVTRDDKGKPYCMEDLRLLENISDRAALAISNARLYESVSKELIVRKRMERALRDSEEKYRGIVNGSIDGIVLTDEQGFVIEVNPGHEKITGKSRSEMIGKPIWDVQMNLAPLEMKTQENYNRIKALIQKILVTGDLSSIKEFPYQDIVCPDGTILTIQSTISPIKTDKGFMIGGIVHDVTDRRKSEEQMRKSLHEKEALLKEVHHRVKNNMQIINSLLSLQSSYIGDERTKAVLIDCQNRIKSMSLIHERLYMSSDFADVDFQEYLESLITSISSSYNINPERISIAVGADKIKLPIDTAIPCGLIVNELITNAVKHAFPEGRKGDILIRISGAETGMCLLEVKDNGVGIRKDLDIETASTLGLQLVKVLVSQINGTLQIDSEAGTTFRIEFSSAG